MNSIVKASSRQIFGLLLGSAIINGFVDMTVSVGLLPAFVSDLLYVAVIVLTIGWILVTGTLLEVKKHGALTRRSYKAFISIGLLLIVTASVGRLFSLADEIMSNMTMQIGFTVYAFTSVFWIATFTAKMLRSNETTEEIDINDYFGDIFLLVFWPIGVWTIQPRVNKIFATV